MCLRIMKFAYGFSASAGFRTRAFVTCLPETPCVIFLPMTHFPQPNAQRRAPRIHLGGSVLALVMLDDGQRAKGKLQTVSVSGGLLRLAKSLNQGDFVEIAFQTQSGPVHGMAEMLSPMPSTRDGFLQPFRFVALEDEHHRALSMTVESVSDRSFQGIRSRQWSAPKSI